MISWLWILELGFWTYGQICLPGPSGPNLVSRPQAPRSRHFLKFYNFIGFIRHSWKNKDLFVNIGARVLDLCLDMSSGPKWPKFSFYAPGSKVMTFFEILWFYWIHVIILEKIRSYLWILEPGFWTYVWICLLGPSGPNLVSRPQAPRS